MISVLSIWRKMTSFTFDEKVVSINSERISEITTFTICSSFRRFPTKTIQISRLAMYSPMWLILKFITFLDRILPV